MESPLSRRVPFPPGPPGARTRPAAAAEAPQ